MASQSLRPGFRLEGSFKGHLSPVRQVAFNSKANYYVSLDDKCIRAWRPGPETKQMAVLNFPAFQPSFITCMVYAEKLGVMFAAALDNSLKLYCDKLKLKASLPWKAGAVLSMVYNYKHDELVTAGSDGVKVWYSEPNYDSYYSNSRAPFEHAQKCSDSGKLLSWTFGKHQKVMERMTLRVPGANQISTNVNNSSNQSGEWCQRMVFYEESQLLLVMVLGNIYVFNLRTGSRVHDWEGLHTQAITGVIYLPSLLMVFTSSQDASFVQWRLMVDGSLQKFKQVNGITTPVSGMVAQDDGKAILTSTLDGMITLWSMESLEIMFRMKVPGSVLGLTFQSDGKFFFHYGNDVKVMRVKHIFTTFRMCNSRPVHIQTLENDQIIVLFEDSSLRVMDTMGKDVFTTVPQLSTKSVRDVEYSTTRKQLVVLLGNGHVHVWHIHSHQPPRLARVWNHLMREKPCSLVLLRNSSAPPNLLSLARGTSCASVTGDFIILGTMSGEVLLCDMDSCRVYFRAMGFEKEPVRAIALDLNSENLLIHSLRSVKVLRLGSLCCASEIACNDNLTQIGVYRGRGLVGGQSGSLQLVDLSSGRHIPTARAFDHSKRVTAISTHHNLPFFLTASMDGWICVLDRNKSLHAMLLVAEPVECVCFLNDAGDILVGVGNRLLVAKSEAYETVIPPKGQNVQDSESKQVEVHLSRYSSGFNVWRPGSASAPQLTSTPRSFPKKSLVVEVTEDKSACLANRKPLQLLAVSGSDSLTSHCSRSSSRNGLLGMGLIGRGKAVNGSIANASEYEPCRTQYTVELPMILSENENNDEEGILLAASSVADLNLGPDKTLTSKDRASEDDAFLLQEETSEECESTASSASDILTGLEESFQAVAAVVASREAFFPGLSPPVIGKKRSKTKKKRKKRRRKIRKKKLFSVGLSWEQRAEELRKAALEGKVILGVHELKAQEARTKPVVKDILPTAPKLAAVTMSQPLGFVPRKDAECDGNRQEHAL